MPPPIRSRNLEMVARIEAASVERPVRFAFAGDSGAWPDPTGDAIFAALVRGVDALAPAFFANLGDFAGPGTIERHEDYLRLVEPLRVRNICVVGNHDLDDSGGRESWERVHGPTNFDFAVGHTRFVAIDAAPGVVGEIVVQEPASGPGEEALAYLDRALGAASEPNRIVLQHMPPNQNGRYAPHENWGFSVGEREYLDLLHEHDVKLVCCAHGLAFDENVHEGIRFVMSGGGGTGLCSHMRGVCTAGDGRPEDRGAIFHFVEVAISEDGSVSGRVVQAFDDPMNSRITF